MLPLLNEVRSGELNSAEHHVFSLEVRHVLEQMNEEDRQLCELLMHYPISDVAIFLGISTQAVNRRIKKLRPSFIKAGIVPGNFHK